MITKGKLKTFTEVQSKILLIAKHYADGRWPTSGRMHFWLDGEFLHVADRLPGSDPVCYYKLPAEWLLDPNWKELVEQRLNEEMDKTKAAKEEREKREFLRMWDKFMGGEGRPF